MRADTHQHEAIVSKENTVVRASAGSGKTSVIAQRYLHLVRDLEVPVTDILCLTFTRKAAGEMHERIYNLLKQEESPAVHEQLLNFMHSSISTIDSFCSKIVNNNAATFGINPALPTEPWKHQEFLYQLAIQVLGKHQKKEFISRLIAHRGLHTCARLLMVEIVGQYSSLAYPLNFSEIWKQTRTYLIQERDLCCKRIHENITFVIRKIPAGEAEIIRRAHEALSPFYHKQRSLGELHPVVASFNLSKGVKRNNEFSDECKEYIKLLREESETLALLGFLEEDAIVTEFFDVMQEYQDIVTQQKLERSIYSYHDISEFAIRMLLENPTIREHYKKRFRYIMIDEFQDNNQRQRDLLYLLAERYDITHAKDNVTGNLDIEHDKLFFVGDEKQSIFSFRGADVRVFMQLAKAVKTRGKTITLGTNYRSSKELTTFFNTIFPRIMHTSNEYEAHYEAVQSPDSLQSNASSFPTTIKIAIHPGKKEQPPDVILPVKAEAAWVAAEIAQCIQQGAKPSDIAVLFRSATSIRYYEAALRKQNIAYSVKATHSLLFEPPSNDLCILLRLYLHPEDRQNYVAFLRSPLLRLSDHAIIQIILEEQETELLTTELSLNDDDAAALEAARKLYESTRQTISQISPEHFVYLFWYQWGYYYILLSKPSAHPYLEHFQHLLGIARQWKASLVEFSEKLSMHIRKSIRFDTEGQSSNVQAVQLMSIHAAKGLEFPIVFVCDMASVEHNKKDLLFYADTQDDARLPYILPDYYPKNFFASQKTNFLQQYNKEQLEIQSKAEIKRLLYVALTRAKEHLFLSAHRKRSESGTSLYNLIHDELSFLDTTSSTVQKINIPDISKTEEEENIAAKNTEDQILANSKRLVQEHSFMHRNQDKNKFGITELHSHEQHSHVPHVHTEKRPLVSNKNRHPLLLGSLCHNILEQRINDPAYSYTLAKQKAEELISEQGHNKTEGEKPINSKQKNELLDTAWQLSQVFLDSELWKDNKTGRAKTELSFSHLHMTAEGTRVYINGRIDLLIEFDNHLSIIDYKTDSVVDTSNHILQMAMYEKVCRELYQQKSIVCHLFYLQKGCAEDITKAVQDYNLEENLDTLIKDIPNHQKRN